MIINASLAGKKYGFLKKRVVLKEAVLNVCDVYVCGGKGVIIED
jgi:hypothetical protein